jgi:thiosulfate reductase cytochrome b subunit
MLGAVTVHGLPVAAIKSRSRPTIKSVHVGRSALLALAEPLLIAAVRSLIIHRPDIFGWFSFRNVVLVHNVLAVLLVINAGLSLFYHLASGEIRQFIPRPYGFFDQAIVQAKYYMQGIFKDKEHPFEKTPQKKLNPLQQITYFGILNVLLPLQIITGALMWGVQRWPSFASALGGLPVLAPFHSLVAWVFAGFIVAHVYLTTTGPEPFTAINAMMNGWEDVEIEGHLPDELPAEHESDEGEPGELTDMDATAPTAPAF